MGTQFVSFQTQRLPKFPCVKACCGGETSGFVNADTKRQRRHDRPAKLTKIMLNAIGDREVAILSVQAYWNVTSASSALALTSALSFTRSASTQAGKSVEEIFPRVIDILLATASPQFSNGTTFVVTE
jgi:hypothetical protein